MRTQSIRFAILALAAASFIGCTTRTASTQPAYDKATKKVYTKEELDKRGRQTPGESLAAQDEQITLTRGRRR